MRIILLYITFTFLSISYAQYTPRPQSDVEYHLAFRLAPNYAQGGLVTFGVVSVRNNQIFKVENLNEKTFILIAKGIYHHKATKYEYDSIAKKRLAVNLFEKYKVICGYIEDPYTHDTLVDETNEFCFPITELWKLKYGVDPAYSKGYTMVSDEAKGWAGTRYHPTQAQIKELQNYGVTDLNQYFYGPKMFELLAKMMDEEWVDTYKELR